MNYSQVFMYGSNLNPVRLRERTRNWHGIYKVATLSGYELRFNKYSYQHNVAANITPCSNRRVYGILIELDEADLYKIDCCEGYHLTPRHYDRVELPIEASCGAKLQAYAYIAQPEWLVENRLTTVKYLSHILEGARFYGFPDSYVKAIEKLGQGLMN